MADRKRGAPRVESATAAYKRKLNKLFDEKASGRQKELLDIKNASSQAALVKAIDAYMAAHDVPDDMDILLRFLEHPKDALLAKVLEHIEAFVDSGKVLPRKALYKTKLQGLEFTSFDPHVQIRSTRIAGKL